jgi:hypothetical protein
MSDNTFGEWDFVDLSANEVSISNYTGFDFETVSIPSTINAQTVVAMISENNVPVFDCDEKLKSIVLPNTIFKITGCIFGAETLIETISVDENNSKYISKDGGVFSSDEKTLVLFPPNRKGSYVIPYKTECIGEYAFAYSQLSEVDFGTSVTTVSDYAFLHSSLVTIKLRKSNSISQNAFAENKKIESYSSEKTSSYSVIDGVVYNSDSTILEFFPAAKQIQIKEFILPENVVKLSSYAFADVHSLKIRLSRKLKKISDFAFKNASDITVIAYGEIDEICENAFLNASGEVKTYNETVKRFFSIKKLRSSFDDDVVVSDIGEAEYTYGKYTKSEHKSFMPEHARRILTANTGDTDNVKLKRELIENFPWGASYERTFVDVNAISKTLDENVYGLTKAKRQFLRWVSLYKRAPESPIRPILFIGPQGCGKTMLAEIFAKAVGKHPEFISIPSIEAGWVLSGSNQTWQNANCGKIVQAIVDYNEYPVFIFDEVDKSAVGGQYASPQSILLNLLDQNTRGKFKDAFFEVPIDLSYAFIVLTANDRSKITPFLLDRCYVIEIEPITDFEHKKHILKEFILPKLYKQYNLAQDEYYPSEEIIDEVIRLCTNKSDSIRQLEQKTEILLQEVILLIEEAESPTIKITVQNLKNLLISSSEDDCNGN